MWGWPPPPAAAAASSSNYTPPSFQAPSHFSMAAHHASSSVPFSHTSQSPISAHSSFPHSFYPTHEYTTNKHHHPTNPWNIDISKLDPNSHHHHHHHQSMGGGSSSNDSSNRIGDGSIPATGPGLLPTSQQQQHGGTYDHHTEGFQSHKTTSNTLSTNSPFSMDFILQKPATPIDNAGYYNEHQSSGYPAGYHQPPPQALAHNQFNQSSHSQTQSNKYEPPTTALTPSIDSHELSSYSTVTTTASKVPYMDQTYPSTTTTAGGERREHFRPSQIPPPSVDSFNNSNRQKRVMTSNDLGSRLVEGLPPSEESYSPPELVIRKPEDQQQQQELLSTEGASTQHHHHQFSSRPPVPPQRPVSFGMDDDDGDYDEEGGGMGAVRGFQLAASPPTTTDNTPQPLTAAITTTTINSSYSVSSSTGGGRLDKSTSSTSTSVSSSSGGAASSSSSSTSSSSSSSSCSDQEETPPVTTTTVTTTGRDRPYHDGGQQAADHPVNRDSRPDPHVLGDSGPPHPPTVIQPKEDHEDDDDVFLPSSPPLPMSFNNKDNATKGSSSLTLNKGERKNASVVVGKRGRAAGRILDEDKLRLPLASGWQRIVRTRLGDNNGPTRVDICYVTPCKRRLRTFPEIQRYIDQNRSMNLTIENFSFSKKVNVGVVINEETLMNNATEELSRPRRGRPPKHLLALKEKTKEGVTTAHDGGIKKDTISLEPHEIGMSKGNVMVTEKEEQLEQPHSLPVIPPAISSPVQHYKDPQSETLPVHHPGIHPPPVNSTPHPTLVKKTHSEQTAMEGQSEDIKGDRRGMKRKTTSVGDKTALKKPRGRPKGTGARTSSGGRKPRIPRNVKYIPPPQPQPPPLQDTATIGSIPAVGTYSHTTTATAATVNGNDIQEGRTNLSTNNPRIKKQMEDKEKRRKLLMKAREGGGGRRRQGSSLHQRSQRKLAQQARRERERLVKNKQNEIMKQKEVEMEEIRKSQIARQKENEYRQQALERTRNLMEQLRKQEEERERLARLRQLDIERAEQLRRPTEDLLVKNLVALPPLPKMELVCLSPKAFLDLVTVFQFTNSFEEFLDLDSVPELANLYCGLFNAQWIEETESEEEQNKETVVATSSDKNSVVEVLIQMVKAVTHDPGTKTQTLTGCSLRDIEVKEHTVSEILRLYLSKENNVAIQKICTQLNHVPFPSLRPSDKTRVLSFLTEELLRSSSLCKEIDNRMEQVCTLRRIKWKISLKLKRFRSRFNDTFGAENLSKPILYGGRGRPPKKPSAATINLPNDVDSSDEEGGGGGDDPSTSSEDESDFTDEDSDEEPSEDREELHRRIKQIRKKINCIRSKINTASKQMRVFPLGQDRYSRQYWSLPKMSGVIVEGIDTSTFDTLEKYISDITQKREQQQLLDTDNGGSQSVRGGSVVISGCLSNDTVSRESSVVPYHHHHTSKSYPTQSYESPKMQQLSTAGINTPTPEFTPNPSPPLSLNNSLDYSPDKTAYQHHGRSTISGNHPLEERHQLTTSQQSTDPPKPPSTARHSTTSSDGAAAVSTPWFSILPRKQCEVLHYLTLDSGQQQGGMILGGSSGEHQFLGGGGYAYMTPDGTILGQPLVQQVQMGYALMGNNIVQVPQTQYVLATGGQPDVGGGNQLISLGNGQYALATAPSNNSIQYVSINGNQYAIMQPSTQQENGIASETNQGTYSQSTVPQPMSTITSESGKKDKRRENLSTGGRQSKQKSATPTPQLDSLQQQQLLTLAIPGANGEDPQYVQVPADPRVLSGECSYAVLPQTDGTTQIVLVEKSSLSGDVSAPATTQPSSPQTDETMAIECPHAVVMDNEQECDPWCVDITLMYADTPLPFTTNNGGGPSGDSPGRRTYNNQTNKDDYDNEKKLSQLLEQIDEDLTHGWWSITGQFEFDHLVRCLTMRGFREKNLHKILSKNKDILCHSMTNVKSILPDTLTKSLQLLVKESIKDNQHQELSTNETSLESDKKETATTEDDGSSMEVDIDSESNLAVENSSTGDHDTTEKRLVLPDTALGSPTEWDPLFTATIEEGFQQIIHYLEGMETRLFDAHLPVEGSQKMILGNIENSLVNINTTDNHNIARLSLIANGLLRLESCVQRRYLKRPFKEKHADTRKSSPNDSPMPVEEPLALLKWRNAVSSASSSSQLGVCMNQLERCIAWEKSPMKVFCVVCRTGDNESLLLLCDKCDRGTHTYCCKPKLDEIPEGNWYCHDCVINASRKTVCNVCDTARGVLLHCTECPTVIHKRCHNPPLTRIPNGPWQCFSCRRQNRRTKSNHMKDELILCYELLKEMEEHDDSWPFLQPVDKKKVPGYYKVIKKPMDFSTVKSKLLEGRYSNKEAFAADTRLVFDNCSYYNEDDSEIGIAGHRMKQFFEKKWAELSW